VRETRDLSLESKNYNLGQNMIVLDKAYPFQVYNMLNYSNSTLPNIMRQQKLDFGYFNASTFPENNIKAPDKGVFNQLWPKSGVVLGAVFTPINHWASKPNLDGPTQNSQLKTELLTISNKYDRQNMIIERYLDRFADGHIFNVTFESDSPIELNKNTIDVTTQQLSIIKRGTTLDLYAMSGAKNIYSIILELGAKEFELEKLPNEKIKSNGIFENDETMKHKFEYNFIVNNNTLYRYRDNYELSTVNLNPLAATICTRETFVGKYL
jgi:hypothetical protein